jgi:pimeloyl-ACP methyl ester carboxylesterase
VPYGEPSLASVETHYARHGKVRIAYQVVGEGKIDLVLVPGLVSHLDLIWDDPAYARFCRQLAGFSRLILFDKRGTGASDRRAGIADFDTRLADMLAVMEAARSRRAALFGFSEGGKTALAFTGAHPERVRAVALYGAFAVSPTRAWPEAEVEKRFQLMERVWGQPMLPPSVAPSLAADQSFRRRWARFERRSADATVAGQLLRLDHELDVTGILPQIKVPTLILHRSGDQRIPIGHARHLAKHMPGAKYVEMPGVDHLPFIGDSTTIIDEIRQLLAGLSD